MDPSLPAMGSLLRAFRDRLAPVDVGITASVNRRARGLRREELAGLAGLSVDYVIRLEQGRALNPSLQVVGSLARALHLDRTERDHLFRSAGLLPPADGQISTHLPPGVTRMVAQLGVTPLAVFTADWHLLSWNPLWTALVGEPAAIPMAHRNLVRAVFGDPAASRYLRPSVSLNGPGHFEAALVADLRIAASVYPNDQGLRTLVGDLRKSSKTFGTLWDSGAVAHHQSDRKTITHPDVGPITLDCDVLNVPGSDLHLVVYSTAAETPDAGKLDFLRVTAGVAARAARSPEANPAPGRGRSSIDQFPGRLPD